MLIKDNFTTKTKFQEFKTFYILTVFRMGLFVAAHGYGEQKGPPPWNLSHKSYNDKVWHTYTLPKENLENIWITWHTPWALLTSGFFHRKSANFAMSRNTYIDCISVRDF